MTTENQTPETSGWKWVDPLKWFLQWVGAKPSNLLTFVVLLTFLAVGYSVYINSGQLSNAMVAHFFAPRIDHAKLHTVAKRLREMGADSVVIYEADASQGWRRPLYVQIGDMLHPEFTGRTESLYLPYNPTDSDEEKARKAIYNDNVHQLQMGGFVCADQAPSSDFGEYIYAQGITWGCGVGIPPGVSKYFLGAVLVGYKNKEQRQRSIGDIRQQVTIAAYELLN